MDIIKKKTKKNLPHYSKTWKHDATVNLVQLALNTNGS